MAGLEKNQSQTYLPLLGAPRPPPPAPFLWWKWYALERFSRAVGEVSVAGKTKKKKINQKCLMRQKRGEQFRS